MGHIVTLETTTNDIYRGRLVNCEPSFMNVEMKNVHVTYKNGTSDQLKTCHIAGKKIKFFILPDMLREHPELLKAGQKDDNFGRVAGGKGMGRKAKPGMGRGKNVRNAPPGRSDRR